MANSKLLTFSDEYATVFLASELGKILDSKIEYVENKLVEIESQDYVSDLIKIVFFSGTVKKVLLEIDRFFVEDIGDIYENTVNIPWHDYFSEERTFAVRALDLGTNLNYKKSDIERDAGQGIVDLFLKERGRKPKVRLSEPDIEVFYFLRGTESIVALDLTGRDLNTPEQILARSLIIGSNWEPLREELAEILSGGVSQSAWDWGKREPYRNKVSRLRLLKTNLLDKQKILNLLKKEWTVSENPIIYCYERPERMQIVREQFKDYKRIILRDWDEWTATEAINVSNLVIAEPGKSKQEVIIEKLLKTLESGSWNKIVFSIRDDLFDKFDELRKINKVIIKNDIVVRGLKAKIIIIER